MSDSSFTYKKAGVDIDAADSLKKKIAPLAQATFSPDVLTEIGLFGGMFRLDASRLRDPILVSSVDGVGTKLKIAFATGRHNTIGVDLVSHCVNDILMQGARPLVERKPGMTDMEVVVQEILEDKVAIDYDQSDILAPK